MTYDLRTEAWIPYRRDSGRIEWGAPALLLEGVQGDDPVVALASPRPDFDGAILEFLVGLLSLALTPEDEDAWLRLWHAPPTPDQLAGALAALPAAFDLDGDGPRIFQDLTADQFDEDDRSPIAQLLIDAPGEQGIRHNKDLFVKRERVQSLSRAAGAMALITMQTYAPAGGAGNRTSMRGGGPLTTLVDPRPVAGSGRFQALWYFLWANVETVAQREARAGAGRPADARDVFPWLAPTRHSDARKGGSATTPRDADPFQVYFGLPRRLRLDFGGAGRCGLTGRDDSRTVIGFRQRPSGVQYLGWHHPLTPHYEAKDGWLPLHGQSEGVVWRDWLGLLVADAVPARRPAQVVAHFLRERGPAIGQRDPTIRAFGYDMDNMKARGWVDARVPAFVLDDDDTRERMVGLVRRLVDATGLTAYALQQAVKDALFGNADAPGDLSDVKHALWQTTDAAFYDAVRKVVSGTPTVELLTSFRATLERETLRIFDQRAGTEATALDAMRRLVGARYGLVLCLRGRSKMGEKLFAALALPLPERPPSVPPPQPSATARAKKSTPRPRGSSPSQTGSA